MSGKPEKFTSTWKPETHPQFAMLNNFTEKNLRRRLHFQRPSRTSLFPAQNNFTYLKYTSYFWHDFKVNRNSF